MEEPTNQPMDHPMNPPITPADDVYYPMDDLMGTL